VYKLTVPVSVAPGADPWFDKFSVPLARLPVTELFPLTVKSPARFNENALIDPVVARLLNVGADGSLGRITLGSCFVVIPGPLNSSSYFPVAA
jgi:hypothetical protein